MQLEFSHTAGRSAKWYKDFENVLVPLARVKHTYVPCDLDILLIYIYCIETVAGVQKETVYKIVITAVILT